MKRVKIFVGVIILATLVFSVFLYFKNDDIDSGIKAGHIKIGGQIVKVSIADTVELQEKGLSGREKLEENEGMLFVFQKADKHAFWMKDMNFPIDIIWLDESKNIIFIKKNVLPETFPEIFMPEKESLYVLELAAGFSEKNNLQEGNFVKFLP